jgi:tetratricopeptide (TPR) repeat protein
MTASLRSHRRLLSFTPSVVLAASALAVAATGCRKERPLPEGGLAATTSATALALASGAASAVPGPSATSTKKTPAPPPTAAELSPEKRKAFSALVRQGREHSGAKRWADAVASFDRALALAPMDGSALCDLGYVAYHAGDFAKAEAANTRALSFVHEPDIRARVLFNQGMVFEAKQNKAEAARYYQDSLALRPNATVAKRLAALSATPASASAFSPTVDLPCQEGFPNTKAMCACLIRAAEKDRPQIMQDDPIVCEPEKAKSAKGELFTVIVGPQQLGEKLHLAVSASSEGMRPVAILGRDFEPGAFGVHNEATVTLIDEQTIDGKPVFVVRSQQLNTDHNMAGLERYADTTDLVTYCVPNASGKGLHCPLQLPSLVHATLSYPDFDELDAADKKEQAERRKGAYDRRTELSHDLSGGRVQVKLVKGSAKDLPPGTVGPHPLP